MRPNDLELAQTTEAPEQEPLVVNGVVFGPFGEVRSKRKTGGPVYLVTQLRWRKRIRPPSGCLKDDRVRRYISDSQS